jgi:chorismate mutase
MMDEKLSQKLDVLDERIVALFEQRMVIAQKAMAAMTKRELRREAKALGAQAADKATSYACDVSNIAYTEELIKLILCASLKHQRRLLQRVKKQCGC